MTGSTGVQVRVQSWTDFNQPDTLSYRGKSVAFSYDAGYKRVKEITTDGATVRTLFLVHPDNVGGLGFEREETRVSGGVTRNESRHYISVGGSVIAVVKTLNDSGTVSSDVNLTNYWHKDGLGSIVAVTNASGLVLERMAYDAWGRRQRDTGRVDPDIDPANGNRGFTGHEHLDELGLIHMNGRVYDPFLGRFLSADSVIEAPQLLQSYNRYSYVLNNPLKYTDPSGHCIWDFCIAEIAAFIVGYELTQHGNSNWRVVGQIMMMVAASSLVEAGLGTTCCVTELNTFNGGGFGNSFVSAAGTSLAVTGGDLGQALKDGLFAMAFTWAGGQSTKLSFERLSLHALIGCVQGASNHGSCGPSAMAAVVGKAATGNIPDGVDNVTRGVITAVAGGTASVIGGGKFSNGALQAGFGYLYNFIQHLQIANDLINEKIPELKKYGNNFEMSLPSDGSSGLATDPSKPNSLVKYSKRFDGPLTESAMRDALNVVIHEKMHYDLFNEFGSDYSKHHFIIQGGNLLEFDSSAGKAGERTRLLWDEYLKRTKAAGIGPVKP